MSELQHDNALLEALDWVVRIQATEFDEWEAHAAWLEADPANPAHYLRASEALSKGLSTLQQLDRAPLPVAANDIEDANDTEDATDTYKTHKSWWAGAGVAVAASVAAFFVLPHPGPEPKRVMQTAPAVSRNVMLAGGTSLSLNGDTRVTVIGVNQRRIIVQEGEVFAKVHHDAEHPFEIVAEGRLFRDVGTEINVSVHAGTTRLSVAEGAVTLDPQDGNLLIDAGRAVVIEGGKIRFDKVSASNVGSWRRGRLIYADDDLKLVADDLTRSLGRPVRVAPELARTRFTGVLTVRQGANETVHRLADLLGVTAVETRSGWLITGKPTGERVASP